MLKYLNHFTLSNKSVGRLPRFFLVAAISFGLLLSGMGPAFAAKRKKRAPRKRPPIVSKENFRATMRKAIRRQCRYPGRMGVFVRSLQTGEVLYAHNPDEKRTPASNVKILTSATALARLGPDYVFATDVYADAPLRGGVIKGNLYLKGYGDPVLVQERLHELAHQVRLLGVRRVTGNLVADDSFFDRKRFGLGWKNAGARPYQAPHGALSLNFSVVTIYVEPGGKVGAPARVRLDPPSEGLRLENRVVTGSRRSRPRIRIRRRDKKNMDVIQVSGRIPLRRPRRSYRAAISDPTRFTAASFRAYLKKEGITIQGGIRQARTPKEARLLARDLSQPLGIIIRGLNKFSNNFMAEQLLKTMGAELHGLPGTAENGLLEVRKFLVGMGISPAHFELADGSGLSRLNQITPRALTKVLGEIYYDFRLRPEFVSSLAVVGVDGTVRKRLRGRPEARRVRAKTGLLFGVYALSGYAAAKNGEVLAFSILINENACRPKSVMHQMLRAMVALDRPVPKELAGGFRQARRALEFSLPQPRQRDRWRTSGRARMGPEDDASEAEENRRIGGGPEGDRAEPEGN